MIDRYWIIYWVYWLTDWLMDQLTHWLIIPSLGGENVAMTTATSSKITRRFMINWNRKMLTLHAFTVIISNVWKCKLSNCLNVYYYAKWNVCLFVQYSQKNERQRWFVIVASYHISKMLADDCFAICFLLVSWWLFLRLSSTSMFTGNKHYQVRSSMDFVWYHLTT